VIVDTSALIAILRGEAEAADFRAALATVPVRRMSIVNYFEAAQVLDGACRSEDRRLDAAVAVLMIDLAPVTLAQGRAARRAFQRFGKGLNPAGLNQGDCFAYALAEVEGEPLLFKGQDFPLTDITPAI
jgi:ribonuclease VapC